MSIKKNSLWNLIGAVGPMLIGMVAIPYIFNKIGAEKVGVLTIIWALIGYFNIFDFGLGRSITQRIASLTADNNASDVIRTSSTGLAITLVIGLFGAVVGYSLLQIYGVEWIKSNELLEKEIYQSFVLSCFAVPITTVTTGLRGILEGKQRFGQVNVLRFVLGISNFLGPVFSIITLGDNLTYIVFSLIFARIIMLIMHFYLTIEFIKINKKYINKIESNKLFKFAGWLTLSNLISPLMVVADRFFLASMLSAAVVSYYTIPVDFLIRLLVIPASITSALFPVFSAKISEKNRDISSLYKKSLIIILMIMLPVSSVVFFLSRWGLEIWIGADFALHSFRVASIMAIGILFNSLAQIPHAYIQASGDAKTTAIIHLFESFIYIPLLILGISNFGIIGAALAWTGRALLDFCLLHLFAKKINKKIE